MPDIFSLKYEFGVGPAKRVAFLYGGALPVPGLGTDSEDAFFEKFEYMFYLTAVAAQFKKNKKDETETEVANNLASLRGFHDRLEISDTGMADRRTLETDTGTPGTFFPDFVPREHLSRYRVTTAQQKIVTFSDVHITNKINRQNFFESSENKELYLDILRYHYGPREFTLVENGDVEELLIFEPDIENLPNFKQITWDDDQSWNETFADRDARKRTQFETIVQEHADYYLTIDEQFISRGAYYRTIGNHDTDLASEDYAQFVRDTHGIDWPTASDFVILTKDNAVTHMICHGHQFDPASVARFAPKVGESLSQGGGWAYQGPDRIWSLDKDGDYFLLPWLNGSKHFENTLSSAEPTGNREQAWSAFRSTVLGEDLDEAGYEAIFTGNIAWEYFVDPDPARAYNDEAFAGKRWFKFRHMDEINIVDAMNDQFSDVDVTLVLGHSHEPRLNAGHPKNANSPATKYLNSAAAGRFENLIWGIEIIRGEPTMISWHRDISDMSMVRTEWNDTDTPETVVMGNVSLPGKRILTAGAKTVVKLPQSRAEIGMRIAIENLLLD